MGTAFRAVLFDLDGTLLDNDMDTFLPHYFRRLAGRVVHLMPADTFIRHLLQATQAMMDNDGRASNAEVFAAAFYPLVGHSRQEMEPIFLDFYARDFPALREYSRCRPEARPLVRRAFELGCDVVIATNPLFPATAIEQRLEWAGVADFPYRLVTSYENSRACKPNPLYFREVLGKIGRPPETCLMVGDDPMDMAAARVGCATFLVTGSRAQQHPSMPEPTYRGTLADVAAVLERRPLA